MGNSDALGNRDTSWDSNVTDRLDWHLSALSVHLLLALRSKSNRSGMSKSNWSGRKSNWSSSKRHWSGSKRQGCGASSKTAYRESIQTKELSISLGISISFSICLSFTLDNSLGKELSSSRNNASRKSIESGSIPIESTSKSIDSKSSSKRTRSNQTSIMKAIDSSNWTDNWSSMGNNIGMSLNMDLSVSAYLMDNILALLDQSCFRNSLGLGGALLLGGTLLVVCALLLCCALRNLGTLLISHSVAPLLWHLGDNIGALLLSVSGALLLRHITGNSGALLHGSGGALFLSLSDIVCDSSGVADRFRHCCACLGGDRLIGCVTLGCIVLSMVVSAIASMSIARICLSICVTQGIWNQTK